MLVVTNKLRIHVAPEVYESAKRARLEAGRAATLFPSGRVHLRAISTPNASEAQTWLMLAWRERELEPWIDVINATSRSALEWLVSRVGNNLVSSREGCWHEALLYEDGQEHYVAIHRVKRVWSI